MSLMEKSDGAGGSGMALSPKKKTEKGESAGLPVFSNH